MHDDETLVRIEPEARTVRVSLDGVELAVSHHALRLEEDPLPPVWYLPVESLVAGCLILSPTRTSCPHKGQAIWYSMVDGPDDIAWCYRNPTPAVAAIGHRVAFDTTRVAVELDGTPALRTFAPHPSAATA